MFGCYLEESRDEEEKQKVDMLLSAPDICARHCRVRRREWSTSEESSELVTLVKPGKGATVTYNGLPLNKETQLNPGDLLGMGAYYLFMYKDPTLSNSPRDQKPAWFPSPVLRLSPDGELNCKMCGCPIQQRQQDPFPWTRKTIPRIKDSTGKEYIFVYNLVQEDALLNSIIDRPLEDSTEFKLTPAFLLCLCIQHSATSFQPADFRKLLLRIASQIQTVMW
ncbi:hypothetical protein scyTo_0026753, partial [Scyliorhinus torazame]|nr:hypothetical protein [Scyliorhinus torazame]